MSVIIVPIRVPASIVVGRSEDDLQGSSFNVDFHTDTPHADRISLANELRGLIAQLEFDCVPFGGR